MKENFCTDFKIEESLYLNCPAYYVRLEHGDIAVVFGDEVVDVIMMDKKGEWVGGTWVDQVVSIENCKVKTLPEHPGKIYFEIKTGGQIELTINQEGVIADVWDNDWECSGTMYAFHQDFVDQATTFEEENVC